MDLLDEEKTIRYVADELHSHKIDIIKPPLVAISGKVDYSKHDKYVLHMKTTECGKGITYSIVISCFESPLDAINTVLHV